MTPSITATMTIFSVDLCERILESIHDRGQFTTVTDDDPRNIAAMDLALFGLETHSQDEFLYVTHLGIIKKGQRVATGQVRLRCYDLIELPKFKIETLIDALPKAFQAKAQSSFGINYKKVPPKTGEALFKALLKVCPDQHSAIERISDKLYQNISLRQTSRNTDAAFEKDALGICLDIFGVERKDILRSWDVKRGTLGSSFLNGLTSYTAYEDDLINHDLHTVPGWQIVTKNASGIVNFQNKDGETLTVINANRKPLEKALGVDLIYFHRKYEAFTFIQYKMMDKKTEKNNNIYYSPTDKSHKQELERMQGLHSALLGCTPSNTLKDFRIGNCPIFFKICKKLQLDPNDTSISAGAYIPIDQWSILLKDPSIKGPKGGLQIGYHTLNKRYIGTQVFVELMQRGFLGTQSIGSQKIALFIESAVKQGHSVMYAIDQSE